MGQDNNDMQVTNRADRVDWFRDLGFGMFIHWSIDSQLGSVISHSLEGASADYVARFFGELPQTFNPHRLNPKDWAVLAKLAGMKYVMFTTKHHSGFCMFDTDTTDFSSMHTPYKRDIVAEVVDAFREQGIAIGLYFSCDDFYWLHKHGLPIERDHQLMPLNQPELMIYAQAQLKELLTKYGPIDLMFFDGKAQGLIEYVWSLQPDVVITSGALTGTEQRIPNSKMEDAFESCFTMGTQWQYKPTNEEYKSGTKLIEMLIETRAKGGNLLLNVGPKPDGELPIEQEARLREVALWMFVNRECVYNVRPWTVTNEGDIWFTKHMDEDTVYAIVKQNPLWKKGQWRDIILASVGATEQTQVSVLGQNDTSYKAIPLTMWEQKDYGLHIRAVRAQRLYNNGSWPNPVVLKITHVKPEIV